MSTSDNNRWLTESGEYVLGTMHASERVLFEKVLNNDPEARAHVEFWEHHFAALEHSAWNHGQEQDSSAFVPAHVWENINASLDVLPSQTETELGDTMPDSEFVDGDTGTGTDSDLNTPKQVMGELIPLPIRMRQWKGLAITSLAASLVMGSFLVNRQFQPSLQPDTNTVASASGFDVVSVLRNDSGTDLWVILAETSSGRIRAVALEPPQESLDNSHQLWVVLPDDAGVQSVGLLPYNNGSVSDFELFDASEQTNLLEGSAFAVSMEPPGGTQELSPTGPVISVREYTRLKGETSEPF